MFIFSIKAGVIVYKSLFSFRLFTAMPMVKIKVKGLFASGLPSWFLPIRLALLPMDKIKVFLKASLLTHSFTINWSLVYTHNLTRHSFGGAS